MSKYYNTISIYIGHRSQCLSICKHIVISKIYKVCNRDTYMLDNFGNPNSRVIYSCLRVRNGSVIRLPMFV